MAGAAAGSGCTYDDGGTPLLAAVLDRALPGGLLEFADRCLLRPLGVEDWHWQRDRAGIPYGFAHLTGAPAPPTTSRSQRPAAPLCTVRQVDSDRRDLLGDEPDDLDDRYDDDPYDGGPASGSVLRAVLAPEALALASLVLAGVSLIGFSLLNGSPYLAVLTGEGGAPDQSTFVLSGLLGAGLALLPVLLGVAALRRLPEGSPSRATAGAGVVVAAVSVVLRLVITVQTAAADDAQFVQF